MATLTSNYALTKPDGTDKAQISVINTDMDQIDAQMKKNQTTAEKAQSTADAKQDPITLDDVPVENSKNPVQSGGVYSELAKKQNNLTFDSTPTSGSTNPVTSNGILAAIAAAISTVYKYKGSCTVAKLPTSDREIGDVWNLADESTYGPAGTNVAWDGSNWDALMGLYEFDDTPISGSAKPVKSGGIYSALLLKQNNLTFDSKPISGSTNPVQSNGILQAIQDALNNALESLFNGSQVAPLLASDGSALLTNTGETLYADK